MGTSLFVGAGGVSQQADALPQQSEQHHHQHQGRPGEQGQPPLAGGEIAHALGEDDADGGLLRGEAEA